MADCMARVRGIPHIPAIKEVNVREGSGTNTDIAFKAPVGMSGLDILGVVVDNEKNNRDGKVYQWFRLRFHGGAVGWVRDDLLEIEGDCQEWGYPELTERTFAFELDRDTGEETTPSEAEAEAMPAAAPGATSSGAKVEDIERIKQASFRITAAFEGTGYKAYNNYDRGIVSYGLMQFTLGSGSLGVVLERYLAAAESETAEELSKYRGAVAARDPNLRHDTTFKSLLLAAAEDEAMQKAQDEVATVKYWDAVVKGYIKHRGLQTPLAWALLFDMGVNFGTGHGFVRLAEEQLGVPKRSRPGENGITEEQLITRVAELRKQSHDRQAEEDHLPGLKVRGDFWMDRVRSKDWGLEGDSKGRVDVHGRMIQVR